MKQKTIVNLIGISLLLACIVFLSGYALLLNKTSSYEIDQGQRLNFSIYTRYQGDIYASVPSDGNYLIDSADTKSFKTLVENPQHKERQFAIDKHQAYCGNLAVPNFKPATAQSLGNSYFTDGTTTVYCAAFTEQNFELSGWQNIWQSWLYGWNLGNKPQVYFYPMHVLPNSATAYQAILKTDLASNGTYAFFQGKLMPDANPKQLQALPFLEENNSLRESLNFYRDHNFVYYQNYKLPLKSNDQLFSFKVGNLRQEFYLYDPTSGAAFVNNLAFDPQFAPYQILSRFGGHVNQMLFLSKNGVYFYDGKKQKIRRAGDNPFKDGNWEEIAPLIFTYNNQTYFLQSSTRSGNRRSPGLVSRSTKLYRLDENKNQPWEKISDASNDRYGQIWKKGNTYYFFDKLGVTQLLYNTMYRITDQSTLTQLLNAPHYDEIRKMASTGKLKSVSATEILEAKTNYKETFWGLFNLFDD